jgi:hypothetical protein
MIVFGKERDYIVHDENNIKGFFGDFRYLSNFEECEVYFEGVLYPSTEAAYQAAKSLNPEIRKKFLGLPANQTKKLGREIKIREDWEDVKYDVMSSIVFDKFYRHLHLRKLLLETGDKYIEETNHWKDVYWGVCNGEGKNNLGKILIAIREFWKAKYMIGNDKVTTLF